MVLGRLGGAGEALGDVLAPLLELTPPAVGEAFDVMPEYSGAEG